MPSPEPTNRRHLTRALFFILFTISSKEAHAWKTRESWESLAKRAGTDKVTTHAYEKIYEMWLAPWRHEAVNFLEIGLGCDMTYGPGKSLSLWEEYFTHRDARVSFLEVDGVCVKNHAIKLRNGTIFVGSQEDESVLRNIAAEGHAVGGYDVIVDDGGHTMKQQLTSLKVLWPAVSSGGLYVIEDLQTSYMPYVSLLLYLFIFHWFRGVLIPKQRHSCRRPLRANSRAIPRCLYSLSRSFLSSHLLSLNNTYIDFKNREYGGGPRGKSGTAIEHVKELLEHVNCEYSGLACEEMHLDFVYCVRKACALGKKNVLGRAGARPHTAVLASG
jgi:hypothetical protein